MRPLKGLEEKAVVSSRELIAAGLALCTIAVVLVRSWRPSLRLLIEGVAVAALSALLAWSGTQPFPTAAALLHGEPFWTRCLRLGWWAAAARTAASGLDLALDLRHRSRQARLLNDLLTTALYVAASLVVLNSVLGLRVGALVATSGVVAVVIGLALQTTLADLFSGVALGLEAPFHIGDRIELADGAVEGDVVCISWRSVRLLTDGNDVVTAPNSLVAKARILNRTALSEERGAQVEVSALANWAAAVVIDRLREAALLTPGVLESPPPLVVMTRLGHRLNGFAIRFRVASSRTLMDVKSRLLVQVQRQVRHAGLHMNVAPDRSVLLKSLPIFDALTDEQLTPVARAAVERSLGPGEDLFVQDELGSSVFVLVRGVLEARRREATGETHVLGRIGPGEYIGEIGMMTGDPRPVTVRALTPIVVLELTRAMFYGLLAEHPGVAPRMQASVERGLSLLERDAAALEATLTKRETSLLSRIRLFFAHHAT